MIVKDSEVKNVWTADCGCDVEDQVWTPDCYQESGTPICPECGEDMRYSHTEVNSDGLIEKSHAIATASSLVDDGENEEYTRGIAELIAYLYTTEDELPSDVVDKITQEIIK